jgi:hypothetical protein
VTRNVVRLVTAAAAVMTTAFSIADDEPVVTDRPTFTESARVVNHGRWQAEMGATYDHGSEVTGTSLGELLIRWGVAGGMELRLSPPSYLSVDDGGTDRSGFLDTAIGLKVQMSDGTKSGFWGGTAATVTVSTSMPTGSSAMTSSDWQPRVSLAASWTLSPSTSLGTNLGSAWLSDGGERFDSTWVSAFVSEGLTARTAAFLEVYGINREQPDGPSKFALQAGVTYLPDPDVQLDARIAKGLSDAGPDFLLGLGATWRF